MSQIQGSTALVTGGASGIGELMVRRLTERNARAVAIWDIQSAKADAIAAELSTPRCTVHAFTVDLTDPVQVQSTLSEMHDRRIDVDILINNAGIVVGKSFVDHTAAEIAQTMNVNAMAPMYLTRELLPPMIARGRGHIVNIASAAGMVSNPQMTVYCASKWALTGWSDSLRLEMEQARTGVHVTTVMPFYIDTGMFAGVRSKIIPLLQPAYVADAIVRAIEADEVLLRLPWIVNFVPALRGLLPTRWFDKIAGEWFGIYSSMRDFRGRS